MIFFKKLLCAMLVLGIVSSNLILSNNSSSFAAEATSATSIQYSEASINELTQKWSSQKTKGGSNNNQIQGFSNIDTRSDRKLLSSSSLIQEISKPDYKIPISGSFEYGSPLVKDSLKAAEGPSASSKSLYTFSTFANTVRTVYNLQELRNVIYDSLIKRVSDFSIRYIGNTNTLEEDLYNIFSSIYSADHYLYYSCYDYWSLYGYVGDVNIDFNIQYLTTLDEENYVDSRVSQILGQIIKEDMNVYKKEKAIHDYIISSVEYQADLRTAYSALYQGRSNCLGYSLLAYKMFKTAGIDIMIVEGEAGGEGHAWNLINIAGNWYHLDCTWDDPVPDVAGRLLYNYFNLSDSEISEDHYWVRSNYPAASAVFADNSSIDTVVTFSDMKVDSLIRDILGKRQSSPIFKSELASIEYIDASNMGIGNLEGFQHLVNLRELSLYNNNINDISALGSLTQLEYLGLDNNPISDISPLSSIRSLCWLSLTKTNISDISAISGLTNINTLYLDDNRITDISQISGLTKLVSLYLNKNQISSIQPLSHLTNLMELDISDNYIESISSLQNLTALNKLDALNNRISDISAVSNLTNLTVLGLGSNLISNLSPLNNLRNLNMLFLVNNEIDNIEVLSSLSELTDLYLAFNYIQDISPLSGLTKLTTLYLGNNPIRDYSPVAPYYNNLISKDFNLTDNTIASLENIMLNGSAIEGFSKSNFVYDIILPEGSPIPDITVTPSNSLTEVNINIPREIPGTAIIDITALDRTTHVQYKVHFFNTEEINAGSQRLMGGTGTEGAQSIQPTCDGGYVIAGYSSSDDGDIGSTHGSIDAIIAKVDKNNNLEWTKCFGGSDNDWFYDIKQDTDGGYIAVGDTSSKDGDVIRSNGYWAPFIVKTDSTGKIKWKTVLDEKIDNIKSISISNDGGYFIAGTALSADGSNKDFGLVKLNTRGIVEWKKCYGNSNYEELKSMELTSDGGFIMAGNNNSRNGDCYIVKVDSEGNMQWEKALGGSYSDQIAGIRQTSDGGFITAATTDSNDGDVSSERNGSDFWIFKLKSDGSLDWQKCFGGNNYDYAKGIYLTNNDCSIIYGYSWSTDLGNYPATGYNNTWVLKLSPKGNILGQIMIGGSNSDYVMSAAQTAQGILIAGTSDSTDIPGCINQGSQDIWTAYLNTDKVFKNTEKNIKVFSPPCQVDSTAIDTFNHTVSIKVPYGTNLTGVIPLIGVSRGAKITPDAGTAVDLTKPVQYKVTAEDGTEQLWNVTAEYAPSANAKLSQILVNGSVLQGFSPDKYTYELEYPFGTFKIPLVQVQAQETTTVADITQAAQLPGTAIIKTTAEDITAGLTYTVHFRVADSPAVQWQKTVDGISDDLPSGIASTPDGGYITAITTMFDYTQTTQNHGSYDILVTKYDKNNEIQWKKYFGGKSSDYAYAIQRTLDNGYIITGCTNSGDGDLTGLKTDSIGYDYDGWIFKLDSDGNILWNKCFGTIDNDIIYSLSPLSDGSYIAAGAKSVSYGYGGNAWLIKLSALGEKEWDKSYGGGDDDQFYSVIGTQDGGFVAAGKTISVGGEVIGLHRDVSRDYYDGWLVKFNNLGAIQWQKCLGGTNEDSLYSLVETDDGKIITAGYARSYDGDLSGIASGSYGWVVKLSSEGIIENSKTIPGTGYYGFGHVIKAGSNKFLALSDTGSVFATTAFKFDNNLNVLWKKVISTAYTLNKPGGIILQEDGSHIAVVGQYNNERYDVAITKLAPDSPGNNAALASISINGIPLEGFDKDTLHYRSSLSLDAELTSVAAIAEDPNAQVSVKIPSTLPGLVSITVLAEDQTTGKEYTIYLTRKTKDECFIATAAYGSKYQPAVTLLRKFRDKCLLTNSIGTAFVKFYYRNSPPIADFIRGREWLKAAVRVMLTPLIAIAYAALHPWTLVPTIVFLAFIIFVWKRHRLKASSVC